MDYTEIFVSLMTTVITIATPVIVTAAIVYGRKALAAFETSKYAEAYSKLDPTLKAAIDTAADEAISSVRDSAIPFGRAHVKPYIHKAAIEAAHALGEAAGVRVDLQPSHLNALVSAAAREAHTVLDEADDGPYEAAQGGMSEFLQADVEPGLHEWVDGNYYTTADPPIRVRDWVEGNYYSAPLPRLRATKGGHVEPVYNEPPDWAVPPSPVATHLGGEASDVPVYKFNLDDDSNYDPSVPADLPPSADEWRS